MKSCKRVFNYIIQTILKGARELLKAEKEILKSKYARVWVGSKEGHLTMKIPETQTMEVTHENEAS